MLSFIMCIRLARSSIIWHLEAVGAEAETASLEDCVVPGVEDRRGETEGR